VTAQNSRRVTGVHCLGGRFLLRQYKRSSNITSGIKVECSAAAEISRPGRILSCTRIFDRRRSRRPVEFGPMILEKQASSICHGSKQKISLLTPNLDEASSFGRYQKS
jgi:hypothetical protein